MGKSINDLAKRHAPVVCEVLTDWQRDHRTWLIDTGDTIGTAIPVWPYQRTIPLVLDRGDPTDVAKNALVCGGAEDIAGVT